MFYHFIVNIRIFKILGDYEPNDDECEWPSDEEDDELAGDMKVKHLTFLSPKSKFDTTTSGKSRVEIS